MKAPGNKEKAIDEIVKIIQDFQYNDELSEKYKREILDQDKINERLLNYIRKVKQFIICPLIKVLISLNTA